MFATEQGLLEHGNTEHIRELEARNEDIELARKEYANQSAQKKLVALSQTELAELGPQSTA